MFYYLNIFSNACGDVGRFRLLLLKLLQSNFSMQTRWISVCWNNISGRPYLFHIYFIFLNISYILFSFYFVSYFELFVVLPARLLFLLIAYSYLFVSRYSFVFLVLGLCCSAWWGSECWYESCWYLCVTCNVSGSAHVTCS